MGFHIESWMWIAALSVILLVAGMIGLIINTYHPPNWAWYLIILAVEFMIVAVILYVVRDIKEY
jgi:hypothetical protein